MEENNVVEAAAEVVETVVDPKNKLGVDLDITIKPDLVKCAVGGAIAGVALVISKNLMNKSIDWVVKKSVARAERKAAKKAAKEAKKAEKNEKSDEDGDSFEE